MVLIFMFPHSLISWLLECDYFHGITRKGELKENKD